MRKYFLMALGAVMALGMVGSAFAATDAYLNVRIIVVANDLSITQPSPDFVEALNVPLVTQFLYPGTAATFTNNSTTMMEDFTIRANSNFTNGTDTWTLVGGVPGTAMTVVNEARMAVFFGADWVTPIAAGDFLADDVVTLSDQECTPDVFSRSAEDIQYKGYDVPVSGTRNLYISVDTPMTGSNGLGTTMVAPIIVTATNGWL